MHSQMQRYFTGPIAMLLVRPERFLDRHFLGSYPAWAGLL